MLLTDLPMHFPCSTWRTMAWVDDPESNITSASTPLILTLVVLVDEHKKTPHQLWLSGVISGSSDILALQGVLEPMTEVCI